MTGIVAITPVKSALAADDPGKPVDVEFKADVDGSPQRYVEILPKDFQPSKPCDVLIALHGHGSDRWQYVKTERDECKAPRDFAARHAMIMVSPDYRAATSWMGPKAEADLVQIIALLRNKYRVRKVFLVGGSMGGTAVLIFSALHPELVAGISSQNGTANMLAYQNFQDAIAASYGGNKQQQPEEYKKRSPELVPEKFTMPVAFTVGGKDTSVPPDSVRRLAKRLQEMKRSVLLIDRKDTGHTTNYEDTTQALEFIFKTSENNNWE
ncbi:MAG: alpha/beta fold hydrolase [Verrucomicrobia bacterium]|nr:alpha/beta fold hydrolase [Verrucomicrobiota bacterium]MBU1734259.1 alpha/beta fold hydrolase [Verrucomicrobiota bacterium]MBU1856159.1 alpha/beta fold hydrolase [Verrucomicrobiota bacterium]